MGSFQTPTRMRSSALLETSCGYLLQELQLIWDEVGQEQFDREKVLLELEQECLEVYRRKVDGANISRARLHQALADSEAEFTHLFLSLDERSLPGRVSNNSLQQPEKMAGTLKEQLDSITPALREMQLRKEERVNQFRDVQTQIQKISAEITGQSEIDISSSNVIVNENDLSLKKLEEYQIELQRLHKEKVFEHDSGVDHLVRMQKTKRFMCFSLLWTLKKDRLLKVEGYVSAVRNLSATLGMDSSKIITKVHPSLDELSGQQSKNISDTILAELNTTLEFLKEEKQKRLEKLHKLGKALTNLWSLMDTSYEDRRLFSHVTALISVSATEISSPGSLTVDIIQQAEAEVERLDQLKASKMKELFLKKQIELEEICKRTHMEIPSRSEMDSIMNLINSGEIDHADLLISMDEQISKAKEETSSRKVIMEKDENRYSVSRGAHKNLKRAERARVTVNKIPALVDSLIAKTRSWEEERNKVFLYDEEKKKVQGQVVVEQENLFWSRPSTSNRRLSNISINGGFGSATPLNRRLSMGIQQLGSNSINSPTQGISFIKEGKKAQGKNMFAQRRHASHLREETASVVSTTYSGPLSP
ncbi:hypothetical protein HHK36_032580 [Tetracentron sinense]|uniref:Uncharacterized protein n=1 Tax=Tetracentron sinense TaxID=13715 RepID=A0A834Y8X8_TETSI|nr:hypothetical protein HHK36_032580 [Tetracentron sinense]